MTAGNAMPDIQTGVPLPTRRPSKYNWAAMQPGDSFFVPGYITIQGSKRWDPDGRTIFSPQAGGKVIPGAVFIARDVVENGVVGVRCWRRS